MNEVKWRKNTIPETNDTLLQLFPRLDHLLLCIRHKQINKTDQGQIKNANLFSRSILPTMDDKH